MLIQRGPLPSCLINSISAANMQMAETTDLLVILLTS